MNSFENNHFGQPIDEDLARITSSGVGGFGIRAFGVANDGNTFIEPEKCAEVIQHRIEVGDLNEQVGQAALRFVEDMDSQRVQDLRTGVEEGDLLSIYVSQRANGEKIFFTFAYPALDRKDDEVIYACIASVPEDELAKEVRVSVLSSAGSAQSAPRDIDPILIPVEEVDDLDGAGIYSEIATAFLANRITVAEKKALLDLMAENEKGASIVGSFDTVYDEEGGCFIRATFPMTADRAAKVAEAYCLQDGGGFTDRDEL